MKQGEQLLGLVERAERTVFYKITVTPAPHIDYVSPAITKLLGYRPEDFYGDISFAFAVVADEDRSRLERFLQEPSRAPMPFVINARHANGAIVCFECDYHVIADDDGVRVEGLAQDATARRLKENELERLGWELEQARVETLQRLALAAEYRDDDTHQHTQRVAETSAMICNNLGLPANETHLITLAAPLHDIGKIGIPDKILLKPGPLTPREFEEMKTHTSIGGAILSGSQSAVLDVGADIALSHHERWDGDGYPHGIQRDGIPLAARILAVADVLDALTHDRPYKKAWPLDRAMDEVGKGRGTQFDPDVVDALLAVRDLAVEHEAVVVDLRD